MQKVIIEYIPYVGLIHNDKFVKTKNQNDGKLYFFEFDNGDVSMDDFRKESVDKLIANPIEGVKLLGYVEMTDGRK